jgi:UDP-N-acetylmuramoyl-L-alanyl-D-glutamate--2,6-diaminopimelate ligase
VPQQIVDDIRAGMRKTPRVIRERAQAIATAISGAAGDDIVLVAGKGHEDYQIVGTEKLHFDDREVAHSAIQRLGIPGVTQGYKG